MKSFYAMGMGSYDIECGQTEELYINNFGYYRDISEDICISRPHGRKDFHLLYVSHGELTAFGERITDGGYYIFLPDEPQKYSYKKYKDSIYYWIHFTGISAGSLAERKALNSGAHKGNGRKNEADALLRLLSDTLKKHSLQSDPYAISLLLAFFELLSSPPTVKYPFSRAIGILENTEDATPICDLAAMYRMCPSHFIRSFKRVYGTSPANYRTAHRISLAQSLLAETELKISVIAQQCGFSDPLYFSRLFKRHVGMSPANYRTVNRD